MADEMTAQEKEEAELRRMAEKRVRERMELLSHIVTYVLINGLLVVIWWLTGHGYPWFLWITGFWGLVLLFHIINYFTGKRSESRREEMIQREMERMRK
jgi:F0F1-type ATP synthase assembly protein I